MRQFLLTLVLLGALQGFISSILISTRRYTKIAGKLLSALIFLIALANLNIFLWYQKLSTFWSMIGDVFPLIYFMPIGPLLYLFVRTSLQHEKTLVAKDFWHFIPTVFDLIPYTAAGLIHLGVLGGQYVEFIDFYNVYIDVLRWISLTVYCILSWRLVYRKTTTEKSNIVNEKRILLPFAIFQTIWLIFLCLYLAPQYRENLIQSVGWFPLYIPLSLLIYWLGFTGFIIIATDARRQQTLSKGETLTNDMVEEAKLKLRQLMENDQLFLNPRLNLNALVSHSGLSQKIISAVLNQHMNTSFSEFINSYRIEAFKVKIKDPSMQRYTIKGIAMDCGFSSLATFQRVFKDVTGQLPSDFRREHVG